MIDCVVVLTLTPGPISTGDVVHAGSNYPEFNLRGFFACYHPQLCPYNHDDVVLQLQQEKAKSTPEKRKRKKTKTFGVKRRMSQRLNNSNKS